MSTMNTHARPADTSFLPPGPTSKQEILLWTLAHFTHDPTASRASSSSRQVRRRVNDCGRGIGDNSSLRFPTEHTLKHIRDRYNRHAREPRRRPNTKHQPYGKYGLCNRVRRRESVYNTRSCQRHSLIIRESFHGEKPVKQYKKRKQNKTHSTIHLVVPSPRPHHLYTPLFSSPSQPLRRK